MKLALYSDLHLDLLPKDGLAALPPLNVDVVVLAGDIGKHTHGLRWATEAFADWPGSPHVVYVMGNHEYYGAHLGLIDEARKLGTARLFLLEHDVLVLPGVRILGCTLWSGFTLNGIERQSTYLNVARRDINDFWCINTADGRQLHPTDTLELHRKTVEWLDSELAKPFDGATVVVSHFAPHRGCVADEHRHSMVSPYFVTDLSRLMERHRIAAWCYGHTHTNTDFMAHGCRVVSNQRGYSFETRQSGFRPDLVIEV